MTLNVLRKKHTHHRSSYFTSPHVAFVTTSVAPVTTSVALVTTSVALVTMLVLILVLGRLWPTKNSPFATNGAIGRYYLGAPGLTTSNKKLRTEQRASLLGASALLLVTRSYERFTNGAKGIATRSKCLTTSNKKLRTEQRASLLGASALLVVTRSY